MGRVGMFGDVGRHSRNAMIQKHGRRVGEVHTQFSSGRFDIYCLSRPLHRTKISQNIIRNNISSLSGCPPLTRRMTQDRTHGKRA